MPTILETDRLQLSGFSSDDAAFILTLLNDPGWLRYIGDKRVRTLADAREYLAKGPMAMLARLGFGLYRVALKIDGTSIGMCGLIKREELQDVDIGFAFLPQFRSQGYALEAAAATLRYAKDVIGLRRIAAITTPDNLESARLLQKLGLRFERMHQPDPNVAALNLYSREL